MEKFWKRVDRRSDGECWPWLGGVHLTGYGIFKHEGGQYKAHRVAYALARGGLEWSTGQRGSRGTVVRHTCDRRDCCNPSHLVLGTQQDNMVDAVERKRMARGERHPLSRLTPHQVTQVRALVAAGLLRVDRGRGWFRKDPKDVSLSLREVGAMFGVSGKTIEQLVRGRAWRDVP